MIWTFRGVGCIALACLLCQTSALLRHSAKSSGSVTSGDDLDGKVNDLVLSRSRSSSSSGDDCDGKVSGDTKHPIEIHLILWKRPASIGRLLHQLVAAEGYDAEVPLYLHVEGGAHDDVYDIVNIMTWPHGPKIVDFHASPPMGLRGMWLSTMTRASLNATPDTLMLVLEDDMRVSQGYFKYLREMTQKYAGNEKCRDKALMGFSLSAIRLQEMEKPFYNFTADFESAAYLSTTPSSWGGVYFADRWLEFASFAATRLQPAYYNGKPQGNPEIDIPRSHSTAWINSWKRFMVDFMYGRGLYMLYPNLPNDVAPATTFHVCGMHVGGASAPECDPWRSNLCGDVRNKKVNRRVACTQDKNVNLTEGLVLPEYSDLPVLDLFMAHTTREKSLRQGVEFLETLANTHPELAKVWARPEWLLSSASDIGGSLKLNIESATTRLKLEAADTTSA